MLLFRTISICVQWGIEAHGKVQCVRHPLQNSMNYGISLLHNRSSCFLTSCTQFIFFVWINVYCCTQALFTSHKIETTNGWKKWIENFLFLLITCCFYYLNWSFMYCRFTSESRTIFTNRPYYFRRRRVKNEEMNNEHVGVLTNQRHRRKRAKCWK